jgi:hypothetical protein
MYQIKRGDEVILSEIDLDIIAEIFIEVMGFYLTKKPIFAPDIMQSLNKLSADANLNLTIKKVEDV